LLEQSTHPNIINLKDHFIVYSDDDPTKSYLNLVSDYYPETLTTVLNFFRVSQKKV
jgi:hypothetical protein